MKIIRNPEGTIVAAYGKNFRIVNRQLYIIEKSGMIRPAFVNGKLFNICHLPDDERQAARAAKEYFKVWLKIA